MKKFFAAGLALAALLLNGCLQVEDELTILPDGSGTVRLVTKATVPEEMAQMMGMSMGMERGGSMYPPTSEAEAKQFFPAKDFTVKVEEKKDGNSRNLTIQAAFKDINALLASPYAKAHQLSLKVENGAFTLKALSGAETVARSAEIKPEGEMAAAMPPGFEEMQKKKGEMKFLFRVNLPGAVTTANVTKDGKSVTWTAERAKAKDADEFLGQLTTVMEARCAADGVKAAPVTPPRLGLVPFKDLAAGMAAAAKSTLPDTNKIAAAVKFVPYTLQVTRSIDLAGEGSSQQSQAQFSGAVIVPAEFAPPQWGEAKLLEAVDAKGNSLKPKDDDESGIGRSFTRNYGSFGGEDEEEDDETGAAKPKAKTGEQKHMVNFTFKSPDWKVKEIARIKGSITMQYLGDSEVLKLSNAVPANIIMDMSKPSSFANFRPNESSGSISDARLTALGMTVRVQTAMAQSGMTMLMLDVGGGKGSLVDAQVFDADGHPWPTTLQAEMGGGDERTCQLYVAGKPKAPLSLGLLVSSVGASVEVPILVEKIPVGGK